MEIIPTQTTVTTFYRNGCIERNFLNGYFNIKTNKPFTSCSVELGPKEFNSYVSVYSKIIDDKRICLYYYYKEKTPGDLNLKLNKYLHERI